MKSLADILKLYNEHVAAEFPNRRGDEIKEINLVLIDSDTAGLISRYIHFHGRLSNTDTKLLYDCYHQLQIVVSELTGEDKQYFERLKYIAELIIREINGRTKR